ncbi:MAG TPA: hypothetical protein VGO53_16235 [Steroidobacteraceae bacterium]|jgi:hypothetical protein|nr:hypothetical protein [Steroidobacteraceae bacterium]
MATKNDSKCLQNAADDEPIFVLRAKDKLAPLMVRSWVHLAAAEGTPNGKIAQALEVATQMEAWGREHGSKVPD